MMKKQNKISRRKFISTTSSALAFTIVPRHIIGGVGFTPPSDQIRVACIGVGSQGIRVMINILQHPDFKITSVCDVNKEDTKYFEWIRDGAIGHVYEVHNWSSRPFWPQGIDRPAESMPVPENLDWDLWLGPAPFREYHTCYQPFAWRGWKDFGNGAIGDMGCYSFDTIFRVLKLRAPESVEASGSRSYVLEGTTTNINTCIVITVRDGKFEDGND